MHFSEIKSMVRFRGKILKSLQISLKKPRKIRPIIHNPLVSHRQWLALDNYNSYKVPFRVNNGKLKNELYRFYNTLLALADKFSNPFNYTDAALVDKHGFNRSCLYKYKTELEKMGLVSIGRVNVPELKWPVTHYLIIEFWND